MFTFLLVDFLVEDTWRLHRYLLFCSWRDQLCQLYTRFLSCRNHPVLMLDLFFNLTLHVLGLPPEEGRSHTYCLNLLFPALNVGLRSNQLSLFVEPFASFAHPTSSVPYTSRSFSILAFSYCRRSYFSSTTGRYFDVEAAEVFLWLLWRVPAEFYFLEAAFHISYLKIADQTIKNNHILLSIS